MKKLLSLLFALSIAVLHAQDNKGTDFWIGFTPNINTSSNTIQVYITSDVNTNATVSAPGIAFNQNVAITAGVISTVTIPTSIIPTAFIRISVFFRLTSGQGIISGR